MVSAEDSQVTESILLRNKIICCLNNYIDKHMEYLNLKTSNIKI